MDEIQVKYLTDIFSISRHLEIIPEHNECYKHYIDLSVMTFAPVTERLIKVFMVKSTITTENWIPSKFLVG